MWFNKVRLGRKSLKEKKRGSLYCLVTNDFPFIKTYENNTIGPVKIQEKYHPSLRKGNGKMLCSKCLEPLEYSFSRKRNLRYTGENGPTTETITVVVGYCLKDGHYSTILSDNNIKNKQYCISEIRSVLENKASFSLASPRTKAYWKSWFKKIWETVIENIHKCIRHSPLCENDISISLKAFLKKCGNGWLRYVLDLFSTNFNNLCMFFDTFSVIIKFERENLHKLHLHEDFDAICKSTKPP